MTISMERDAVDYKLEHIVYYKYTHIISEHKIK